MNAMKAIKAMKKVLAFALVLILTLGLSQPMLSASAAVAGITGAASGSAPVSYRQIPAEIEVGTELVFAIPADNLVWAVAQQEDAEGDTPAQFLYTNGNFELAASLLMLRGNEEFQAAFEKPVLKASDDGAVLFATTKAKTATAAEVSFSVRVESAALREDGQTPVYASAYTMFKTRVKDPAPTPAAPATGNGDAGQQQPAPQTPAEQLPPAPPPQQPQPPVKPVITGYASDAPALPRHGATADNSKIDLGQYLEFRVDTDRFTWGEGDGEKAFGQLSTLSNLIVAPRGFTPIFGTSAADGAICVGLVADQAGVYENISFYIKGQSTPTVFSVEVIDPAAPSKANLNKPAKATGFAAENLTAPVRVDTLGNEISAGDVLRFEIADANLIWDAGELGKDYSAILNMSAQITAPKGFLAKFATDNSRLFIELTALATGTSSGSVNIAGQPSVYVNVQVKQPTIPFVAGKLTVNPKGLDTVDDSMMMLYYRGTTADSGSYFFAKENFSEPITAANLDVAKSFVKCYSESGQLVSLTSFRALNDAVSVTYAVKDGGLRVIFTARPLAAGSTRAFNTTIVVHDGTNASPEAALYCTVLNPTATNPVPQDISAAKLDLYSDGTGNVRKLYIGATDVRWYNGITTVSAAGGDFVLGSMPLYDRNAPLPLGFMASTAKIFTNQNAATVLAWFDSYTAQYSLTYQVDTAGKGIWVIFTPKTAATPAVTTPLTVDYGSGPVSLPVQIVPYVAASGNRITGIADGVDLGAYAELNGRAVSAGDLSDLEVRAGDELRLYLTSEFFTWENGNPTPPVSVTASHIRQAKIDVYAGGANVKTLTKKISIQSNSGGSYISIQFIDRLVSTSEKDFRINLYLLKNRSRKTDSFFEVDGTMTVDVLDVYYDDGDVDISGGEVLYAESSLRKLRVYIGDGVYVNVARMAKGMYAYGVATTDLDNADDRIFEKHNAIEKVYNLYTIGLNKTGNTVELQESYSYYVYNEYLEYVGRGNEKLPYSTKYYLAAKKLELETPDNPDIPDDPFEPDRIPTEEPSEVLGGLPSGNNNYNPGTGR